MKHNVKENNGAEIGAQLKREALEAFDGYTTEEKAQYEVFRNGGLPRETLDEWIKNDLKAILSFVHGCLNDQDIFNALATAYFERYKKLHTQKPIEDVEKTAN